MIEVERSAKLDGKTVSVYYEGWFWRVWLEGEGNIGIGSNEQEAIADAEATIGRKLPWNL